MVKDKIFKTGCGLYCREKAFDDMHYMHKKWTWCFCPVDSLNDCQFRIPFENNFKHCALDEETDEYIYELSVEKALEERENECRNALKKIYSINQALRGCRFLDYDYVNKKVKARAAAIKNCMKCGHCVFLPGEEEESVFQICVDVIITERFDCGDLFGEQERVTKYERYPLISPEQWNAKTQCERWMKNRSDDWKFCKIDNIRIGGYSWGTIRDVYLKYTPDGYIESRGWINGSITAEHSEPYLVAKRERKPPQLALIAKAEKEAKRRHRLEIYRKRIKALIKWLDNPAEHGENDNLLKIRQRKLDILADKYPDIYYEESEKYYEKQKSKQAKLDNENAQMSLFEDFS